MKMEQAFSQNQALTEFGEDMIGITRDYHADEIEMAPEIFHYVLDEYLQCSGIFHAF